MSHLIVEILLRVIKPIAAALCAWPIYLVATALDPAAAGAPLALLCYAAAAASLLLLESSPL